MGTQYRTGVYYTDVNDLPIIEKVFQEMSEQYGQPLAVELLPLQHFIPAEEYHQDYLKKNPNAIAILMLIKPLTLLLIQVLITSQVRRNLK